MKKQRKNGLQETFDKSMFNHYVRFADMDMGCHIVRIMEISLHSEVIRTSPNPDEEPDDIDFIVRHDGKDIKVNALVWTELETEIMNKH